jgi:hypothetical protein
MTTQTFFIVKDPFADLDYSMDWTAWLTGAETIASSAWAITPLAINLPVALTQHTAGIDVANKIATVWLAGGSPRLNDAYFATNSIVTNSTPPRSEERTVRVTMMQR